MNSSITDLIGSSDCHRNTVNPHPMQAHDSWNMVLSLNPYCKILDPCGIYEYIRLQQRRSQSKETVKLQIYCNDIYI